MSNPSSADVAPAAWHPIVAGLLQALRPAASGAVLVATAAREVAEAALAAAGPTEMLAIVTDLCVAAEALRARQP